MTTIGPEPLHIIFFLGAGASVEAGFPIHENLFLVKALMTMKAF